MANAQQVEEEVRRLDPIDRQHLIDSWDDCDAKRMLLESVTSSESPGFSAAPPAPRRHSRRAIVVAACVALLAAGIAVAPGVIERTSIPAFAIRELPNGVIEIENIAEIRDAKGLEAELREFGIDAVIETQVASPSLVGQAQAFAPGLGDRPLPGLTFGEDGTPEVFRWRIDPKEFRDEIVITLNVQAHEGEAYQTAQEVFAPGEVLEGLHCALGDPLRAKDVAARLPDLGLTAEWYILSDFQTDASGGSSHSEEVEEVPEGEVTSGYALNDRTVRFEVVPDHVTPPEWHQPELSNVPCTDEQAARWR